MDSLMRSLQPLEGFKQNKTVFSFKIPNMKAVRSHLLAQDRICHCYADGTNKASRSWLAL